jgi:hypothetical protein
MAYYAKCFPQDASTGRIAVVQDAIKAAAKIEYGATDIAVAYVTRQGVALLNTCLNGPRWLIAEKRFLISIDFGITEPDGLIALAALPNSQVRIPNGLAVLSGNALWPPQTFHTKAFAFRTAGAVCPLGIAVGSANITVSGLATGAEAVDVQVWLGKLTPAERSLLNNAKSLLDWFDDAWESADALADILTDYQSYFKGSRFAQAMRDDRTKEARAYMGHPASSEVTGTLAVQLSAARELWVKTETMYSNRGGRPGNQLDMPRGTRVFFGFPATPVPRNTTLGHVEMQVPGSDPVSRSVRFGNNSMDKIDLPIPSSDADSYDDSYLIFTRLDIASSGMPKFQLFVTDQAGLDARKDAARNFVDLKMASGRQYGLLF